MVLETDKKIIGEKFKQHRKSMNLTQFQLAELVGLNEKQISRIEAGQNYPNFTTFAKLIEVLEININDFLLNSTSETNKTQEELVKLIKKSTELELKIYSDVIKSIKKNLKEEKCSS